jgi:bisphosphoglycerate-independent phosphoglycerate mutase (AlkP superfamily)
MTVTTIHLEFAGMERMAKWHRLLGAITSVERDRTSHAQKQRSGVRTSGSTQYSQQSQEFVGPTWEQKSLHDGLKSQFF